MDDQVLEAPYVLEYTYQRSTGPVIGRFLGALRDGRLEGVRAASGRVLMPPLEYDPEDGSPTGEPVAVGPGGVVTAWAWEGTETAFALVKLDGADTAMLHKLVAPREQIQVGMRVSPRWRAERTGPILDLEGFVPGDGGTSSDVHGEPVTLLPSPVRLE